MLLGKLGADVLADRRGVAALPPRGPYCAGDPRQGPLTTPATVPAAVWAGSALMQTVTEVSYDRLPALMQAAEVADAIQRSRTEMAAAR